MWTTRDGNMLSMPRSVLRALAAQAGAPEDEVMNEMGRLASSARRVGSFRARKTGRTYPVFRARSGPRAYDMVTRPLQGTRSWPGPRGAWPAYSVIDVASRFADPYADDPAVPPDEGEPRRKPRSRAPGAPGAPAWRGPLSFVAAARLSGGGIYVVEDANGQPVYVGQTASFARRLAQLVRRFPSHRVRVAGVLGPRPDLVSAVGAAVVRAVRGQAGSAAARFLPAGHRYGAALPVRGDPLRVERLVRTVVTVPRRSYP